MRRTEQTKLSDFTEPKEETPSLDPSPEIVASLISITESETPRPKGQMWCKTLDTKEDWGVCNLDGTVLFVQLIDGRLHVYGDEIVCKWCGGILEISEDKVFCGGRCRRYQGDFSRDLNDFLKWEGAKSYTLRKIIAEIENLKLEPRDLESISYAPHWSILYEYADEMESDDVPD